VIALNVPPADATLLRAYTNIIALDPEQSLLAEDFAD
jgi:hypothetical protein